MHIFTIGANNLVAEAAFYASGDTTLRQIAHEYRVPEAWLREELAGIVPGKPESFLTWLGHAPARSEAPARPAESPERPSHV